MDGSIWQYNRGVGPGPGVRRPRPHPARRRRLAATILAPPGHGVRHAPRARRWTRARCAAATTSSWIRTGCCCYVLGRVCRAGPATVRSSPDLWDRIVGDRRATRCARSSATSRAAC
ncbi:MAG: hypothetical protein MZV64_43050 [Ignavibacteriales bacterium]|nr:hypothetical protein [Ignavibacteriales bacterium]